MTSGKALKTTLTSVFRRKGGNGQQMRLFDDLEPAQKQALLNMVPLGGEELPVIGSFENSAKWLLLTTERLTWNSGSKSESLSAQEIRDAVVDFAAMQQRGETKLQLRQLQVESLRGDQYTIQVEEGLPLSGTWNVLKSLGARNRGRATG